MMTRMLGHTKQAIMMTLVGFVLIGVAMPALFTVFAQLLFPTASHGSLIKKDGVVIGSTLLGQHFSDEKYFWGRPSATVPPYNPAASAASNLSMDHPNVLVVANERMAHYPAGKEIPVSFISASASGLDPHISPQAAYFQVPRVARARGLDEGTVNALVQSHIEEPHLGFIGTARVNVLALNMALDVKSNEAIAQNGNHGGTSHAR